MYLVFLFLQRYLKSACDIEKCTPILCTDHKSAKAFISIFCFMYTNLAIDDGRGWIRYRISDDIELIY